MLPQFPWTWFLRQFTPFRERLIVRYISTLNHVLWAVPPPIWCHSTLGNEWGLVEVGLTYSRRRSHQKSTNEPTLNYMRKQNLDKRSGILRKRCFWDLLSGSRIKWQWTPFGFQRKTQLEGRDWHETQAPRPSVLRWRFTRALSVSCVGHCVRLWNPRQLHFNTI